MNNPIVIEALIDASLERTWQLWNEPEHIVNWNAASPDWHSPAAENDLRAGGAFSYRMEARDGSMGFDFAGTYTEVREPEAIAFVLGDGRRVEVTFTAAGAGTRVRERFEPDAEHAAEMQQAGWQAILDSFALYAGRETQH